MSAPAIRAAMEVALATITPALPTAWQDAAPFSPAEGQPWQRVDILFADPRPLEQRGQLHEEPGFMQVGLFYPQGTGPAAVETRAELIRTTFKHGSSFSASGVTVTISNTPSISPLDDQAWTARAVRIPFYAHIRRT